MKSASKKRAPSIVNLTVKRRYLTQREIERLMNCARKHGRYGHRDATMMLVAYRHGLRASEVCDLQWQQIELSEGRLHVHRVKSGIPSVHPIRGDEMRADSVRPLVGFTPQSGQRADMLACSASCQKRLCATAATIALFDHLVGAPEQRDRKSFPLLVDYGCAARSAARIMRLT